MISLGLRKPLSLTIEEIAFKFKEARGEYLGLKHNARDTRQVFLSEIADRPISEKQEEATKSIQRIIQREEVQGGWRFIG